MSFLLFGGGIINFSSKRARILKAFFSTIFAIYFSIMFFQSLSKGVNVPDNREPLYSPSPAPTQSNIVPNDKPEDNGPSFYLTDSQRYYKNLVNKDSTNLLLLGTEPSGFNFDTIVVLSIDEADKKVKIISFPRDIYIDYSDNVLNALKKAKPSYLKEKGINRINAVPSIGQAIGYQKNTGRFGRPYIDFIADVIEEVFGIYVHDFAYVKTSGFRTIVDYFGGVTVYVPVLMNYEDPYQDLKIYIEKGTQHLNGRQAEGYVRFRQGYDENGVFRNYGDIFRKQNQNRFIKAFISQHVTLKNLTKLGDIADIISSNVITSVKDWNSIVKYGALAEKALKDNYTIEDVEIECEEKKINGSSYVIIKTR
ncbi:MAG: LCP family protein [Clostridiaceae bacterium]|nr:LCP family protein [Clostridiaceae bacterium]